MRMTMRRTVTVFVAMLLGGALVVAGQAAQWFPRLVVGENVDSGTSAQIQAVGQDGGVIATATGTEPGREGYFAGAAISPVTGAWMKLGALAFQLTDPNEYDGTASWNLHSTFYYTPGRTTDELQLACWGWRGCAVWPNTLAADQAPGDRIFRINGDIYTVGGATFATLPSTTLAPNLYVSPSGQVFRSVQ